MKKAILWTIAFVLIVVAVLVNGWIGIYGGLAWVMIGIAALCAVLQWLAWYKGKNK